MLNYYFSHFSTRIHIQLSQMQLHFAVLALSSSSFSSYRRVLFCIKTKIARRRGRRVPLTDITVIIRHPQHFKQQPYISRRSYASEHYRNLCDQRKRILMKIEKEFARRDEDEAGRNKRERQRHGLRDNANELCARNVTHTRAQ